MKCRLMPITAVLGAFFTSSCLAAERFATVDFFKVEDASPIVGSLSADETNRYLDDGFFEFDGSVTVPSEGITVPLTVRVRTDDPDDPLTIEEFLSQQSDFDLVSATEESHEGEGYQYSKYLYTLTAEDGSFAFASVTDDPLPAIAWVALAGIASVTSVSITIIVVCDGRLMIELSNRVSDEGAASELKAGCEPA